MNPQTRHYRNLAKNRETKANFSKKSYANIRNQIIEALGGKCVNCGFTDKRALHIDHVNGGGTKENKKLGPQRYVKYLENKCAGLQLLCANCNMIKKAEKKELPFKIRGDSIAV